MEIIFIVTSFLLFFIILPTIGKIIRLVREMLYSALAVFFKMILLMLFLSMVLFFYLKWTTGSINDAIVPLYKKEFPTEKDNKLLWVQDTAPLQLVNNSVDIVLTGDDSKKYLLKQESGNYYLITSSDSFKEMSQVEVQYLERAADQLEIEVQFAHHFRKLWEKDGTMYYLVWNKKKWIISKALQPRGKFKFKGDATLKI